MSAPKPFDDFPVREEPRAEPGIAPAPQGDSPGDSPVVADRYSTPFVNPVNAEDYQMVDMRGTSAGRDYIKQQQRNYNAFSEAAMRQANRQALSGVRGISGKYGGMGAANSGAAAAAAGYAANAPLYAAQTAMAQQRQQGLNDAFDKFTGIAAPQYVQQPSEMEQDIMEEALRQARKGASD